jgi:hypothetical protein
MTPDELQAAQQFVCARPEYSWVCTHPNNWFTVSDISRYSGLSRPIVRGLVESGTFPGAIQYTESVGWRVPRSGLVEYYARQLGWKTGQQAR